MTALRKRGRGGDTPRTGKSGRKAGPGEATAPANGTAGHLSKKGGSESGNFKATSPGTTDLT